MERIKPIEIGKDNKLDFGGVTRIQAQDQILIVYTFDGKNYIDYHAALSLGLVKGDRNKLNGNIFADGIVYVSNEDLEKISKDKNIELVYINKILDNDKDSVKVVGFDNNFGKRDVLSGSVVIDTGFGKGLGCNVMGGNLAGSVIYPATLNDPSKPIEFQHPDGLSFPEKLTGSLIVDNMDPYYLEYLMRLKEGYDFIKKLPVPENDRFKLLTMAYDGKFRFNDEYFKKNDIRLSEKMKNIDAVVTENLKAIRQRIKDFQDNLNINNDKGRNK